MFASKTPRDLNHDPHPYVDQWGIDRNDDGDWAGYDFDARFHFDPRPEFDHVQHNEPNPILVEFRSDVDMNPQIPIRHLALIWVDRDLFAFEVIGATLAHADHARRVLTRLANLAQIGD